MEVMTEREALIIQAALGHFRDICQAYGSVVRIGTGEDRIITSPEEIDDILKRLRGEA